MEEDAFDDNGWSRFFAPNAQSRVDPTNKECNLIQENVISATQDEGSVVEEERGAVCMLKAEFDGSEIDFRKSKVQEQRKVADLEGNDASVDVNKCEKYEEISHNQSFLHGVEVTTTEIHSCEIAPPDVDEAKHTLSANKWRVLDLSKKDKDRNCTTEFGKAGGDQEKAVTKSTPVESLSSKENKGKNNHKEAEEPFGDLMKVATESPHFVLSHEIEKNKDISIIKEIKQAVGDLKKEAVESFRFESSSLEEKGKDENHTKERAKTNGEQAKAACESPSFDSSLLEGNKYKNIPDEEGKALGYQKKTLSFDENKDKNSPDEERKKIGDPEKALFKWTTFDFFSLKENKYANTPDEEEKVVGDHAKPTIKSPSFDSSSFEENKDKNIPGEEEKELWDQEKVLFTCSTSDSLSLKENKDKNSPDEDGKVVGDQPKVATELSFFESLPLKEKDKDRTDITEAGKRVNNRLAAETELHHVNPGGLPSKSAEMKKGEKPQTADMNASKPELLSKSFKLSNFSFSVMLAISITVLVTAAEGSLIVAPKDVIGSKGQEIRLRCSTQFQKAVYWERILVGSKEQHTIYFGINGMVNIDGANGRIKIDSDPATGRYDLVIKNLQPMDAATYICVDDNGIGEEKRAQLIVLDHFSCDMPMPSRGFMGENTVNLPVDNIQASCNLQFRGHVTPRIEWRLNNIYVNASQVNNGSIVKSVITMRGTKELNGAQLSSLPTVSSAHGSESDAIPWWTSPELKVNYIHLEFSTVSECRGESAMVPKCVPACEYQPVEIPGDSQALCYCVAVYNIGSVKYNITFNKQPCHGSVSASNILPIIIALGATALVIIIAFNVVFIRVFKRRPKDSKQDEARRQIEDNSFMKEPLEKNRTAPEKLGENANENSLFIKTQYDE